MSRTTVILAGEHVDHFTSFDATYPGDQWAENLPFVSDEASLEYCRTMNYIGFTRNSGNARNVYYIKSEWTREKIVSLYNEGPTSMKRQRPYDTFLRTGFMV
jgi:hypothetical protein